MDGDPKPYLGFTQPKTGLVELLDFPAMGRNSKSHRPPAQIRKTVGDNLAGLRDLKLRHLKSVTARNEELGKAIGSSISQMQRICAGKLGVSIDQIEALAAVLDVRPQDLMIPYFSKSLLQDWSSSEAEPMDDLQRPSSRQATNVSGGRHNPIGKRP